ncbi:signal peptide peptidase SppA [Acinetobacter larvae]|uniref:S49 family peptidase n=1 Tax=Acinetobacter larvae TaxID=1789224 RepID=A0A1B2LY25_9GAMM|nr:signal peptide peptidase SppA [Acinetobacter larvae]AOA57847.1 S49 family peptidase [Acinetobacter larvae]
MSDWPPKQESQPTTQTQPVEPQHAGKEWQILEKMLLASVVEQRRSRRWNIFFRLMTCLYILIILGFMLKACGTGSDEEGVVGSSQSHLAVVNIIGTIDSSKQGVNSSDTIKSLNRAFAAKSAQAVVLEINSPGGSPVQSDYIWQEIRYLKQQYPNKKVYAVVGDIGASGAYYIASAADEIWVNPSSLIGSIGVIMPNYGISQLTQKLGVEDRTLTAGDNKDILSMTKPVNPEQKAHVQALLDNVHQHFIQAVKTGRGAKLRSNDPKIFSGLFWTGEQAIALGIADKTGSIESLKRQLKIDKTVNYTIERSPLDSIFGKMGASVGQGMASHLMQEMHTEQQPKLQ